ncbi:MAG TPA: hypothetical protein VF411_01020 [Bacteroidia bacterium]
MKTISTIITGVLLSLLLSTSCSKDTITGPTGATGPTGLTGPAGNANVQEYDFVVTNWTQSGNSWYADYSGVTIKKTDAVMVYVSNTTTGSYTALPVTMNDVQTYFSNTVSDLRVTVNSASGTTGTTTVSNPGYSIFKIMIIPSTHKLANVNPRNFVEVKAAYFLKGK